MTPEERAANIEFDYDTIYDQSYPTAVLNEDVMRTRIAEVIAKAVAEEREACAEILDGMTGGWQIAAVIRARGNT